MRKTITPKYAKELLEKNTINRKHTKGNVQFIIDAIIEGRFKWNGETIIISDKGNVMNGQHRLMACVATGISIDVEIVYNVPEEVMSTIDTGKPRTGADVLSMHDVPHSSPVSTMIKLIMTRFSKRGESRGFCQSAGGDKKKIPNEEVLAFYNEHRDVIDAIISFSMHQYSAGTKILTAGNIGAFIYLFAYEDKRLVVDFFRELMQGIKLHDSNVVQILRNKLINDKISIRSMSRGIKIEYVIKAWRIYLKGQNRTTLKIRDDEIITFKLADVDYSPKLDIDYVRNFSI